MKIETITLEEYLQQCGDWNYIREFAGRIWGFFPGNMIKKPRVVIITMPKHL